MSGVCVEECVQSIFLHIALYVVLKVDAIKMMIMMQSVASLFPILPLSLVRVTIEKWGGREKSDDGETWAGKNTLKGFP